MTLNYRFPNISWHNILALYRKTSVRNLTYKPLILIISRHDSPRNEARLHRCGFCYVNDKSFPQDRSSRSGYHMCLNDPTSYGDHEAIVAT